MKNVSYKAAPPAAYKCQSCGAHGVKLWREYQTSPNHTKLLCGACALEDQKKSGPIDDTGLRLCEDGWSTDQIGWLVPAVPDEEGHGFWGYTSVPQAGVEWWRGLPTGPS